MKKRKKYLSLASSAGLVLLLLDFFTKYLANNLLPSKIAVESPLPFLKFFLTHNTGYHYIFGKIDNHRIWASFGLAVGIILISSMIYSILKEDFDQFYLTIYSIVLALTIGAMGNVIEILFTGKATDFFLVQPFPWPTNICDQYINGILYIILPIILINHLYTWLNERAKTNE